MSGGAEIHLFEIFSRLAARGHRVRLVCSGWPGAAPRTTLDGIAVERTGTRHSFALLGRGAVRRALRAEPADVVVEDINKLPLFLAGMTDRPFCAIVPHLFGTTAFEEAPWPMAAAVWAAERPLARAYARAGFHAISESTRDDLVARGVPAARIRVIHPGVDSVRYTPDPAGQRAAAPTFLYVGRLKRYKGIGSALRALALARARRPDLSLDIAGTGDYRGELERLTLELGLGGAVRFHGFVSEAEKIGAAAAGVGERVPVAQGRLGHHRGRGGRVRHAVDRLGQPRPARLGPPRRDRVPGAARRRRGPGGPVAGAGRGAGPRGRARRRRPPLRRGPHLGSYRDRHGATSPRHHRRLGRRLSQEERAMQTTITARHCEISEALRAHALAVMERLGELAHRPIESAIVFDRESTQATAELRLHASRGELLVARGEGDDHRSALDRAEEKMRRQLDKVAPRSRRSRDAEPKIG